MRYNLTKLEIKEIKVQFQAWQEIQAEKQALSEAEKDTKEKVSDILECKKTDVSKLFKALQQIEDGKDNDIDEIGSVLECIRSNGTDAEEEGDEEE